MTEKEYDQCWEKAFGPLPKKKSRDFNLIAQDLFFVLGFVIFIFMIVRG